MMVLKMVDMVVPVETMTLPADVVVWVNGQVVVYEVTISVVVSSRAVGAGVGGATHFVQIVDVIVLKTVEVVMPVSMIWDPDDVTVCVYGQVVTYDVTMSVVTTSWVV